MKFRNVIVFFLGLLHVNANALTMGFVYLDQVDHSIIQELRYVSNNNFVGRPIKGYATNRCILTKKAAYKLRKIQQSLLQRHQSLKVFDCYRPTRAVNDFISWSKEIQNQKMKAFYYPRIHKSDVFKLGYVAEKSGHSRGSTIDLTITNLNTHANYHPVGKICAARMRYNELDMGSSYDCLDPISHVATNEISRLAYRNRLYLRKVMVENDFLPYEKEWWHFTLKEESHPYQYFDFIIR